MSEKKYENTGRLRPNRFDESRQALIIIDQTLLPGEIEEKALKTPEEVFEAIRALRVRGAPAIGVAAAYGVYLGVCHEENMAPQALYARFLKTKEYLAAARPTAVNLCWALERMDRCFTENKGKSSHEILCLLHEEADSILAEDERQNEAIARLGLSLLKKGDGILTHCNAGPLATSAFGTALGPILLGQEEGYGFHVFADETRPLLQGARLTAFELTRAGVDTTLICDNMAASVMSRGRIQAVLVGCDRVAANGDTANKIGTMGVAILAKYFHIPFYVCGPTTTLDLACDDGGKIKIEERPGEEVTTLWYQKRMAPEETAVYNPAFDVTPAELITAIITEKGIAYPPYTQSLKNLMER